jgi:DNA mismatch repair protein MutS2
VLESLIERGCITLATTHHNALKLFGSQTTGAANAAMEFDPQTLKPTYRLVQGRPGRSYGLDMASRLGVPELVVQSARARIGEDDTRLEKLLKEVEENSRVLVSEREALERERTLAKQAKTEAESLLRSAKDEARTVKTKAKADAREVLSSLRNRLRELSRAASLEKAELKSITSEVETLAQQLEPADKGGTPVFETELRAGDHIRMVSAGKIGTVLGSHRGILEIEIDGKKIRLSSKDVMPIEPVSQGSRPVRVPGWGTELTNEEESPSNRLNILGLRVEEGLAEVDRFIDRSAMTGLSTVTIIHGLGTGVLKAAVTELLRHHPLIAAIRSGEPAEGGAGVTVVELKN